MSEVVTLTTDDTDRMAALHRACFDKPWDKAAFRDLLALPGALAVGLVQDGELVSFVLSSMVAGEADILTIATHPDARRKGYGRTVLEDWLRASAALGAARATLDVAADNDSAISLYESFGFKQDGRRPNYYRHADGTQVDAVLYSLKLDASAGLGAAPTA
ncbi:MAG: GNAT family N-acetyltransferase [Pseudomonadota bacterium]